MKYFQFMFFLIAAMIFHSACGSSDELGPKPRAFPKFDYPEEVYEEVQYEGCPFTYEVLKSNRIVKEYNPDISGVQESDCFYNLVYPELNATIYFSYYKLNSRKDLELLVSDTYRIANEINKRSDYMEEFPINKDNDVHGMLFDFYGPAASPMQFILTDSTDHFVRSALYINSTVDVDSLKPIVTYLEEDILRLIGSFEWQK